MSASSNVANVFKSPIPENLHTLLPNPKTPWQPSPNVRARLSQQPAGSNGSPRLCTVLSSDPEYDFILRYFLCQKPPGFSITKITYVDNPVLTQLFEAELLSMEMRAASFPPQWRQEGLLDQREATYQRWKQMTDPFSPIEVGNPATVIKAAKVVALWHGSNPVKCQKVTETGFAYFGKQHFFNPLAKKGGANSTDMGYYGSGIYFTNGPAYATKYSVRGHLFVTFVSMLEPFPAVNDVPHPAKGRDMKILAGHGAYQNYNAHYIPVANITPQYPDGMEYYPVFKNQKPECDELVVFHNSQTLPRFWIEIGVDMPRGIAQAYSFPDCFAACQAGMIDLVLGWLIDNPSRLLEMDALGQNLCFAAVLGNQKEMLIQLIQREPLLITQCRHDLCSLLHIAIREGHLELVKWLYQQAPSLFDQKNHEGWSPMETAALQEEIDVLEFFKDKLPANLIFRVIKYPCEMAIAFLLTSGISAKSRNQHKETLLHLAADAGQEANVLCLLLHGAEIDAQDGWLQTPLYRAVMQRHHQMVQLLLARKANPILLGLEKTSIIHVAAHYGSTLILQDLLAHPACKVLLELADDDGKTPLHKAALGPDSGAVQLLLAAGADCNARSKFLYTPLHWAAMHGHLDSVKLLLAAGAESDPINSNLDMPIDLALRWGHYEVVHFLLGLPLAVDLPVDETGDAKSFFTHQLLLAKKNKDILAQVVNLLKLGDIYLSENDFVKTAKILNCAFALGQGLANDKLVRYLATRLESLEGRFLASQGLKVAADRKEYILNYRTLLKNSRNIQKEAFDQQGSIEKVAADQSKEFRVFLAVLINDTITLLGPPPAAWACISMGSMARNEMCPYSDIKYAFVVAEETDDVMTYFRRLSKIIELRIINLGETSFPIFGREDPSLLSRGFSLNAGGITPLGASGLYELIGTPATLVQFLSPLRLEENIVLANALSCVRGVAGEVNLVRQFRSASEALLDKADGFLGFGIPYRQKFALKFIEEHLAEPINIENLQFYHAKRAFYRPLQSLIHDLALFYGIQAPNSFLMIQELFKIDVFSKEGAANLTKALRQAVSLRFKAHYFYQENQEVFAIGDDAILQEHGMLYLPAENRAVLEEINRVLISFHESMKIFLKTQKKDALNKSVF